MNGTAGMMVATLGVVISFLSANAQETQVDVLPLRGPVSMIRAESPISNPSAVVSIGPDGVFLVDPGLLPVAADLERTIVSLGGDSIRFIVTTHHHGDHSEALEYFVPGATAVAPSAQRDRLATGEIVLGERPLRAESLPVITFTDSLVFHMNGERIVVFTPPWRNGHTDGDALVYFERSGVLCVGDYLFLDRYPIIDTEGGGSLTGYLANIEELVGRFSPETIVVPGHGRFGPDPVEAATLDHWRRNLEDLRATISFVRQRLADGQTADEIVAAGLPEEFAPYGQKPRFVSEERWIRFVCENSARD